MVKAKRGYRRNGKHKGKVPVAVKTYVKKVMDNRIEDKYYSLSYVRSAATNPPLPLSFQTLFPVVGGLATQASLIPLNVMTQGDTGATRTGDIILVKGIRIKLVVGAVTNSVAGPWYPNNLTSIYFRVIVFREKAPEGTGPYYLDFATAAAAATDNITAPYTPAINTTVDILYDRTYNMITPGSINMINGQVQKLITINKRFKHPIKTEFYPITTQAPADQDIRTIKRNVLYLAVLGGASGTSVGTVPVPDLSTSSLFRAQIVTAYEDA